MSKYAIQVEGLSKEYIIGGAEQRHDSFREMLRGAISSPLRNFRRLGGDVGQEERFWALKDISFNVEPGEKLGIIGRNGAGKSTLLKVLSRITSPTEGRIITRGSIASLLEVGTGFHPELTGRENIYLNGAILGMSRSEIRARFDEIVAFSEVEKFLDTPVKRYSSGMYVRLAFSVAAHLDSDILLVDEVLAVGDANFQRRCLGKMDEVAEKGRTVIFVSHNMGMISKLCSRGIVLLEGRLDEDSEITAAVSHYFKSNARAPDLVQKQQTGNLESLAFNQVSVNGLIEADQPTIRPCEDITINVTGEALVQLQSCRITAVIKKEGTVVCRIYDGLNPELLHKGPFQSTFQLPKFLLSPGVYTLSIGGFSTEGREWRWITDIVAFSVINEWFPEFDTAGQMGLVNLPIVGIRSYTGNSEAIRL
jgi:lipopolysaccharide transport system ATP-binding protein